MEHGRFLVTEYLAARLPLVLVWKATESISWLTGREMMNTRRFACCLLTLVFLLHRPVSAQPIVAPGDAYPISALPADCEMSRHGLARFVVSTNDGRVHFATPRNLEAAGIDLLSPTGSLVPAEDANSIPYSFFLSNSENQITYGNLGHSVRYEAGTVTVLAAGVDAMENSEFVFSWGNGAAGPINSLVVFCDTSQVPEPYANQSALVAVVLLFVSKRMNGTRRTTRREH